MTVLGVDPHGAKPYGWALVVDGKLVDSGLADLRGLDGIMCLRGCDLVAVEDQYLNKNYNTAKILSVSAGKALGMAELRGVKATSVNVAKWKGFFHCSQGKGSHVRAVSMVLSPSTELGDDQASAAGIAYFAWTESSRAMST